MSTYLLTFPLFDYTKLFTILLPFLALLVATGLITAFSQAASLSDKLQSLLQVVLTVVLAANLNTAVQNGKSVVSHIVETQLQAKPEEVPFKFVSKVLAPQADSSNGGVWSFITKAGENIFHGVLVAVICVASLVALCFLFLAYLAQELALEIGIAFSPIFLGFLLLSPTRAIGVQFLLHMTALILMPLGWGIGSLVSDHLMDTMAADNVNNLGDISSSLTFASRDFFASILLSVWILLSTIVTPFAMMKMVTSGANLGAGAVASAKAGLKGFLPQ